MNPRKPARRQQILEVLAGELETQAESRITTARLARAVGVSEAALYRHFASKAQMYEALIAFAEDSVFMLFNQVMTEQRDAHVRCHHLCLALLRFSERNPGITRVLVGDALAGEHERLRVRVSQFFARVETQLRQVMRERRLAEDTVSDEYVHNSARLLSAVVTGHMSQFVRSNFADRPTVGWDARWHLLKLGLFSRAD